VISVPQLARDEYFLPGHPAVLDPLTNLIFILVDQCAVEVSVTGLESVGDSVSNLARGSLPCPCCQTMSTGAGPAGPCTGFQVLVTPSSPRPMAGISAPVLSLKDLATDMPDAWSARANKLKEKKVGSACRSWPALMYR